MLTHVRGGFNMFSSVKIVFPSQIDPQLGRFAVELSHLAGFFSVNTEFPVSVTPEDAKDEHTLYLWVADNAPDLPNVMRLAPGSDDEQESLWKTVFDRLNGASEHLPEPSDYKAANDYVRSAIIGNGGSGLESIFLPGVFLSDEDGDGFADHENCRILLTDASSAAQIRAACDLAARMGMETTGIRYPITMPEDDGITNVFRFTACSEQAVHIEKNGERSEVVFKGEGEKLSEFVSLFCLRFPLAAYKRDLRDAAEMIRAALCMENRDGQAAVLDMPGSPDEALLSADASIDAFRRRFPNKKLAHHTDFKEVFNIETAPKWEADEAAESLEAALDRIRPGDEVILSGFLSEDAEHRASICAAFTEKALKKGAASVKAQLLCAYKPGLSWLEEYFAPAAAALGNAERVEIFFNPHVRPGAPVVREEGSPWKNVDDFVDKPPRWLQELYPVDEIIAPILGIPESCISFEAYSGAEDITYSAHAYDKNGKCILKDSMKVNVSERLCCPGAPELGVCAPTTGRLTVTAGKKLLLDRPIATDSERIFDGLLQNIIPALEEHLNNCTPDGKMPELPLFGRLLLEVGISEPERSLPFRDDLISMAEVLAEDLDAAVHTWLRGYCMKKWNAVFDACGHVLPVMNVRSGAPVMKAVLYDHLSHAPAVGNIRPHSKENVHVFVSAAEEKDGGICPVFSVSCDPELKQRLIHLAKLTSEGFTALSGLLRDYTGLVFEYDGSRCEAVIPGSTLPKKDLSVSDIDLMPDRLIGYEDWERMAEKLKRVPGITVYPAGTSYYGRTIYAFEPECTLPGYVSRIKRLQKNASLLIGGRHHANELSASNAVSGLIKDILCDEKLRGLSERLNLTVIPMENPDSAAIHRMLYDMHPGWAHHSCYAPPLGRDLYSMYFREGGINIDGRAYSDIYRRELPDAFIDVHGVPNHDWQHQFTDLKGYKGLWIPRAMLYGFYWYCTNEEYIDNRRLARAWADVLAEEYYKKTELRIKSDRWRERFDKYSYNGINMDFPCAFENHMLNYWVPGAYNPRHPYLSIKYPWITSVSFTAEATDEGAYGKCLTDCAEAQLVHMRSGIELCSNSVKLYRTVLCENNGELLASVKRLRPLLAPENHYEIKEC